MKNFKTNIVCNDLLGTPLGVLSSLLVLIGCLSPFERAQSAVLAVNWTFNGNTLDTSGNVNNGTITGSASYVAGRWDQAINLNSTGWASQQYVGNPSAANLPISKTAEWSMNIWAKYNAAPASLDFLAGFTRNWGTGGGQSRGLLNNAGYFTLWTPGINVQSAQTIGVDTSWHMYTATFSSPDSGGVGTARLYYDGSLVYTQSLTLADGFDSSLQVGGGDNWNYGPNVAADEFTVWSGALNTTEVQNLYNFNTIPEPSTYAMLLGGSVALLLIRRLRA